MTTAALLLLMVSCQSLDLSTTLYGLSTGRVHEGNPVMRGSHLVAVKVSVNLGAVLGQRVLAKRSGAVKWVLPGAFAATGCAAGILNLRTIRKAGK